MTRPWMLTRHIPSSVGGPSEVPDDAGWFRWDLASDRWTWADSAYQLHGYRPYEIVPTTPVLLAHKHPEDLEEYVDVIHMGARTN